MIYQKNSPNVCTDNHTCQESQTLCEYPNPFNASCSLGSRPPVLSKNAPVSHIGLAWTHAHSIIYFKLIMHTHHPANTKLLHVYKSRYFPLFEWCLLQPTMLRLFRKWLSLVNNLCVVFYENQWGHPQVPDQEGNLSLERWTNTLLILVFTGVLFILWKTYVINICMLKKYLPQSS